MFIFFCNSDDPPILRGVLNCQFLCIIRENSETIVLTIKSKMSFNEVLTRHKFRLHMVVTTLSLVILWIGTVKGQNTPDHTNDAVRLRQSTLVVVLDNPDKKIQALQQAANSTDRTQRKKRLKKLIIQTRFLQDSFNTALQTAIDDHYQFSEYQYLDEVRLSSFLDSISTGDQEGSIYFLKKGTTESGASALILYDSTFKPLARPFPYFVRTTSMIAGLETLFGAKSIPWRDLNDVIEKWQKKLEAYYKSM